MGSILESSNFWKVPFPSTPTTCLTCGRQKCGHLPQHLQTGQAVEIMALGGLGFGVWGLGFRVPGSGFGV